MGNEKYIDEIIEKLDTIKDISLKNKIQLLIDERNKLLETNKTDSLTGAYNRRILKNVDEYSVVVLCDIDDFKNINDKYGHDIGDRVLKAVTKVLMDNTISSDVVCRYGGDEFLIIFKNNSQEFVIERMNVISEIIDNSFRNLNIEVSISVGISTYKNGKSLDDVIKEADIALYNSKGNGKHGVVKYKG